jgi:protein-S-isoprenylcysteine O-methyltransferase Ste14
VKQKHFIDSHKAATSLAVLALIGHHGRWESATAWVYFGLHGGYGLLWALKSRLFPDKSWEAPASLGTGVMIWGVLSLYWIAPWLITRHDVQAPAWLLGVGVLTFGAGVFLHFAADMQKWASLRLRPGLITSGLWARTRNPNYLGELLIYGSFALLAMHWLPWTVLLTVVLTLWVPNMRKKDQSLARYPEFAEYKSRSGLLLPALARRRDWGGAPPPAPGGSCPVRSV